MSELSKGADTAEPGTMRTLAVRIRDDLRAQLEVIAQLNDRSVIEEIRVALESWVRAAKSDPKPLHRAESVRAEIERKAETKRIAISAIFGGPSGTPVKSAPRGKQADA